MSKEIWRKTHVSDRYEVSSLGRVRSVYRRVRIGKYGHRVVGGRVLNPTVKKETGYAQICIGGKSVLVHRLVARVFCEGYVEGLVVDHIDSCKTNNRAENLRWVTNTFNTMRPYREDGMSVWNVGLLSTDATKITPIVATNTKTGEVLKFDCAMDAVREYGFDSGGITRCCQGKYKHHRGWKFRYADGVTGFPWGRS